MSAQTLDWSDIPFVLAVCEVGSLSGAARALGVNHSTVFRRIESVEARLGVLLFERLSHGYVMTPAGEHFLRTGLELQDGMNRIQRELGGQDLRLQGPLTVTTTDSVLYRIAPVVQAFQQKYPEIELNLISDVRALDLMQREADIAIRPTQNPPDHWIGRNLLPVAFAVYGQVDYVESIKDLPPIEHRWIRFPDSTGHSPMSKVMNLHMAEGAPVTKTNSMMSLFQLVRSGLGLAVLPCYLAAHSDELTLLHKAPAKFNADLWLLAHPDMRRNAKVHAFMEFASAEIRKLKADFI